MTQNDFKVLNVINSLSAGGAEKVLVEFAIESIHSLKSPIDIVILYNETFFRDIMAGENLSVKDLAISPKYNFLSVGKLVKIIKTGEYSIIHAHLFPASFFVAIASFFLNNKVPLIFTEHSILNRRRIFCAYKVLDKFIYSRFSKIICVSDMVEKELVKWLPSLSKKTVVIPNAVAIPSSRRDPVKIYDIIFVGRLVKAKGVDILLDAIRRLKKKRILKKVAIVGDGPLSLFLKKRTQELDIEDTVNFLGSRADILNLLRIAKMFVLPSRWEGLPLALLEAMAGGLPVIATAVGGVPEVIDSGKDGILVPPGNSQSLANAIEKVLADVQLAKVLGKNARKKIKQKYAIGQYSSKILAIYNEILISH